ncbi:uncharacterized protein BT62DRAFT_924615 [Guyanagaster necrorhizus]|uniref:Uncharacterized protein n=1 Tax=Guyanagaster necrorhizus TaxID=856835 RepID=A0A9P7VFI0_9AGAR|nr:uncharacterized protein BT62DRAFT_924615 [Guyanagaster necrorhizus MCA 3950]KAG7439600.1 hypothetical protein BT62DRAFT_924615 [Guyanagaster necrorhizus MCA 3950]
MSFGYEDLSSNVVYSSWPVLAPIGGVILLSRLALRWYRHVTSELEDNHKLLSGFNPETVQGIEPACRHYGRFLKRILQGCSFRLIIGKHDIGELTKSAVSSPRVLHAPRIPVWPVFPGYGVHGFITDRAVCDANWHLSVIGQSLEE